jgi:hypothetical protein
MRVILISTSLTLAIACTNSDHLNRKFTSDNRKSEKDVIALDSVQTNIAVSRRSSLEQLRFCEAELEQGGLRVYLAKSDSSTADYALSVTIDGNHTVRKLYQPWSVTDTAYVNPQFRVLSQRLILAAKSYSQGDRVRGSIKMIALERSGYFKEAGEIKQRDSWDTVHFNGSFDTRIK